MEIKSIYKRGETSSHMRKWHKPAPLFVTIYASRWQKCLKLHSLSPKLS